MSHVRHQGNRLAHILAKQAKNIINIDNFVTLIEENLSLIELVIVYDVLNFSLS